MFFPSVVVQVEPVGSTWQVKGFPAPFNLTFIVYHIQNTICKTISKIYCS